MWLTRIILLVSVTLLAHAPVLALPGDHLKPVEIEANTARSDKKTGVTIYEGDVTITQGSMVLHANTVTLSTEKTAEGQSEIATIIALGEPARFQQQVEVGGDLVKGKSLIIRYVVAEDMVHLINEAWLDQGGSIIEGNNITYNIKAQQVQARGMVNSTRPSERIKIVIPAKAPDQVNE
jgi:lipopolysaccharide export system protein LptA